MPRRKVKAKVFSREKGQNQMSLAEHINQKTAKGYYARWLVGSVLEECRTTLWCAHQLGEDCDPAQVEEDFDSIIEELGGAEPCQK